MMGKKRRFTIKKRSCVPRPKNQLHILLTELTYLCTGEPSQQKFAPNFKYRRDLNNGHLKNTGQVSHPDPLCMC